MRGSRSRRSSRTFCRGAESSRHPRHQVVTIGGLSPPTSRAARTITSYGSFGTLVLDLQLLTAAGTVNYCSLRTENRDVFGRRWGMRNAPVDCLVSQPGPAGSGESALDVTIGAPPGLDALGALRGHTTHAAHYIGQPGIYCLGTRGGRSASRDKARQRYDPAVRAHRAVESTAVEIQSKEPTRSVARSDSPPSCSAMEKRATPSTRPNTPDTDDGRRPLDYDGLIYTLARIGLEPDLWPARFVPYQALSSTRALAAGCLTEVIGASRQRGASSSRVT